MLLQNGLKIGLKYFSALSSRCSASSRRHVGPEAHGEPRAVGVLVRLFHFGRVCVFVLMWHSCVQVQAWLYEESPVDTSLHSEAAGFLHSRQQLLIKLLVGLVWRDVYSVETGDTNTF